MRKNFNRHLKYSGKNKNKSSKRTYLILAVIVTGSILGVYFVLSGFSQSGNIGNVLKKEPVVCIDAGHGGKDMGASLGDRLEKDDNLRLAQLVKTQLEAKGIKTVMTREDDSYISLSDRCKKANKSKADLFVALHRNSAESGNGVEIWVNSEPSKTDNSLAENILNAVDKVGISKNRGVKTGYISGKDKDYYVNRNTKMPSCLVEMGFITDKNDNKLFDKNLEDYAEAIAQAIYETAQKMTIKIKLLVNTGSLIC